MEKVSIKKVDIKNFVLFFLLLLPFFESEFITINLPKFNLLFNILKLISFLIILILIIINKKISKIIIAIAIYLLILIISTVQNNADISQCINRIFNIITVCLIIDYGLKKETNVFLVSFETLLSLLIYINLLTIIFNPMGMYCDKLGNCLNWFLGYKNSHILFILPSILVSFTNSYYKKNHLTINNYILLVVSILTLILNKSSTSLVGIFIIIILIIFTKNLKLTKVFNIRNYFISYIILFFSIIVFRIQNLFSFIIVDILHKDITFTGRTYIWDYVFKFINKKKMLGYGIENNILRLNKTLVHQSYHAHDQLLEIIYKTGIVGLLSYFYLILISIKELYKYKKNKVSNFISIVMCAYFIMMLTEAYSFEYTMFLFVFCYNVKYLVRKEDIK